MSTTAAPTRALAVARIGVGERAAGGVVLLTGLLALLTWGTWGDIASDTGYDVVAGAKIASGQLPYADFVYYYGPLAPALLGLAALFGTGFGPAIAVGVVVTAAIVAATYALGRYLAGALGGLLAAAITVGVAFEPTNFSFVLPHSTSATLAVLGALCFLLALAHDRTSLAGACAGAVALTRPEFTIAVGVAGVVWVAARARAGAFERRELSRLVVPAVAIPVVVYGVFAAIAGPRTLVFSNLYPVDELRAGGNAILEAYAPFTAASFVELGVKLALYAGGAALLVALGLGLARLGRRVSIAAALVASAAALAAVLLEPEAVRSRLYLAFEWIPAGAALVFAVVAARAWRSRDARRTTHVELAGLAILAVLAAKTYAGFTFHAAPHEQMAAYAAPFAALFLVRLHLSGRRSVAAAGAVWLAVIALAGAVLTVKDAQAESASVGALRATPGEAATYNELLRWIRAGSAPGDPILVAPQLSSLYVLSGRENPLERISLIPGAFADPADERAAIAQLEQSRVRLAVIDRREFQEYGHTAFGGSFGAATQAWLKANFVLARAYTSGDPQPRRIEIWVRRAL